MKRSQRKPLDDGARTLKKSRVTIASLCADPFGKAMRAACVREGEPLSNQPLIVNALDSDCWLSGQVAYWPKSEAIGRRVYAALKAEDGLHHSALGETDIHLILAFMAFTTHRRELCELLGVDKLSDLGVLRHVNYSKHHRKHHVDYALLDVCEFRLDVQY